MATVFPDSEEDKQNKVSILSHQMPMGLTLSSPGLVSDIDLCSRSSSGAGSPDLWSEPSVFGDRARFIDYGGSQPAVLAISDVSKFHDEGKLAISMTSMKYRLGGPFFIIQVISRKRIMNASKDNTWFL